MENALISYSLLAFAAGMTLNFMPCVLPVMPFKVQAILRTTGSDVGNRLRAAGALLAGCLFFFLVLGGVSAAVGLMWGQLFQYAGLRLVLSTFFFASAIATFTGWSLRLPRAVQRLPMAGDLGAFVSGALAGILSTPCAGPFLGAVLAYAATRPTPTTLILFSAIGTGLAAPLMTLIIWPSLIRRLTFSSRFGTAFKSLLGLVLLAAGLFYAQGILPPVYRRIAWMGLAAGSGILLVVKLTIGKAARLRPVFVMALAMLVITGFQNTSWLDGDAGPGWGSYSATEALAAERPVLLYFGADWCINCRTMDRTTFTDRNLLNLVDTLNVLPLKVDLTRPDEARRAALDRFGGYAIPFVVIMDGRGNVVRQFTGVTGPQPLMAGLSAVAEN